jgi:2-oxoglutarate/2-oxoacid ferredoxin oxidoreductase subunit beta
MSESKSVFQLPKSLKNGTKLPFCPGCDHGVAVRLVAEVLDELNLQEKTIAVSSIGCSVMLYNWIDVDTVEAPHGRALAAATGVKRV